MEKILEYKLGWDPAQDTVDALKEQIIWKDILHIICNTYYGDEIIETMSNPQKTIIDLPEYQLDILKPLFALYGYDKIEAILKAMGELYMRLKEQQEPEDPRKQQDSSVKNN